jgi:hypothetical protein
MRASMHRWGWTCTGIGSFGRPAHDLQPALLGTRMTLVLGELTSATQEGSRSE